VSVFKAPIKNNRDTDKDKKQKIPNMGGYMDMDIYTNINLLVYIKMKYRRKLEAKFILTILRSHHYIVAIR